MEQFQRFVACFSASPSKEDPYAKVAPVYYMLVLFIPLIYYFVSVTTATNANLVDLTNKMRKLEARIEDMIIEGCLPISDEGENEEVVDEDVEIV